MSAHDGRRSLPPTAGTNAAIRAGNRGVSDPGARGGNGPARVRRGRSRHAAGVLSRSSWRLWSVSESPRIRSPCARNGTYISRTVWPCSCRRFRSPNCTRSARRDVAGCGVRRVTVIDSLRSARLVDNHVHIGCDGHHAVDVRSVLGTVQGSSLRSARAPARPAGLDGACAQIASWRLRDGRRCDATL